MTERGDSAGGGAAMSEGRQQVARRLEAALAAEELVAQATVIAGTAGVGAKQLFLADGAFVGSLGPAWLEARVAERARSMMEQARGQLAARHLFEEGAEQRTVFIEVFPPPPHLILFGGVHIALPLLTYAKTLGYRVTIVDPRTTFANRERFPHADALIAEWPDEAMRQLTITPSTYIAILTHDPKLDEPALAAVLGKGAAYVGAIGSRTTHRERFERMAKHGVRAEHLAEVHAPIGLELNAETPEEVALAIMGEIVAVRRGGAGGFLRDR